MPAKRLSNLMTGVDSALRGHRLTLCELVRHLAPSCTVRHRTKRVVRLLGNRGLQTERSAFYRLIIQRLVVPGSAPFILEDWSDAETDRRFVRLRAALCLRGFALPIYEEAHPLRRLMSPSVEHDFLHRLQQLLGDAVQPILVADAGFRGPGFTQVETPGWHWIGRVRGRTYVQAAAGEWMGCPALLGGCCGPAHHPSPAPGEG